MSLPVSPQKKKYVAVNGDLFIAFVLLDLICLLDQ